MTEAAVHRVVIVGGGFGGLFTARFLRHASVEVTLVDSRNYHFFQPLLYQLATGILSAGEVAPRSATCCAATQRERRVATVTGSTWTPAPSPPRGPTAVRSYEYDSLIVAAGAASRTSGMTSSPRFAPGMKTIDDALELRGRIFGAFEMAENEVDPEARRAWQTFVVVGGGPTGVEIAGQIAELSRSGLTGNFRRIDPAEARVISSTAARRSSPLRRPALGKAAKELRRLGVTIRTGTIVTGVDASAWTSRTADGSRAVSAGPRSGPPACRHRRWPACSRKPAARPATGPAGSSYATTARCRAIPRCSRSAT